MDPTDVPGNFTNPNYATPQQIAQLRAYAQQLMGPQTPQSVGSWTQALAMGLSPAIGQMKLNQANQLQRQGLQHGQSEVDAGAQANPFIRLLMGGQSNQQSQQGAPASAPGQSALNYAGALKPAILAQESGNNPNAPTSNMGAVGPGQIMPATFSQFAKPGENINNPATNTDVSWRILDSYMAKYGDPARAAVAYYSGPKNVAPPGSPTPWINDISHDRNGNPIKPVSSYVSDIMGRMGGQQPQQPPQQMAQNNTNAVSHMMVSPWVPQAIKDAALKGNTPEAVKDVYGQPGYQTPVGGIQPAPVGQGFQPGVMAPTSVSTPNANISTSVPLTPPGQSGGAPSYGGGQGLGGLQPLINSAQKFGQQSAASGEVNNQIKSDVQTAFNAIPVQQTLRTMENDIEAHGDKMVFGPTADWLNNFKRAIAQHAPGFLSESDLSGLASADSFEKLSAQLQTLVGRQVGSTDASLFQGMKSVPGSHNSKEGALALIKMLDQVAGINSQFMQENFGRLGQMSPGDYLQAKNQFYTQHPIINPLSGQPIRLDLQGKGGAPNEQQTKTLNGKTYMKINGVWHEGS